MNEERMLLLKDHIEYDFSFFLFACALKCLLQSEFQQSYFLTVSVGELFENKKTLAGVV